MATAPTADEFVARFPAFTTTMDDELDQAISEAANLLDSDSWGANWTLAVMLEAAHTLTLDALSGTSALGGVQGAGGPISSVSAAGVTASFASPIMSPKSLSSDWYNKTVYGQRLLRLRAVTIAPMDISL